MEHTQRIEDGGIINEFFGETYVEALKQGIYEILGDLHFKYDTEKFLEKVVDELIYTITEDKRKNMSESEIVLEYLNKNYPYNI